MNRTWKQSLMTVPGTGVALLPKLACPLCWPAYAGLLSSVGLGFLMSAKYLLPITTAFLALAVGALAFRAHRRHGYGPFMLGLFASAGVLVGKFWWDSSPAMYASLGLLVIASAWNVWPLRVAVPDCCAAKQIN
jgi:hypothetical protein